MGWSGTGGWGAAGAGIAVERHDLGRRAFPEEELLTETRIPIPAVGVQDPERGSSAGRTGPAARNDHVGGLPDDITPEPDPRPSLELQTNARPLPDRGGHRAHEARRFEDEQGDPRSPGKGREPTEPIGEPRRPVRTRRQVHDEEIHGPAGQERSRDRQAFLRPGRGEDHEPLQPDAAGHGLHRVECRCEVQPGDDRPARLGFRNKPERQRGSAAREVPAKREAHSARQPAGPEDGVQGREAGGVDAGGIRPTARVRARHEHRSRQHRGCHREGAHHLPCGAWRGRGCHAGARRGRSPARSKGRESRRHVRGKHRHQVASIEHVFE